MFDYPFTGCLNPQRITNRYTGEMMVVPCGHCLACEQRRNFRLSRQCDYEAMSCKKVVLVTLTFANHYVPFARIDDVTQFPDCPQFEMRDDDTGEYLGTCAATREKVAMYKRKAHTFGRVPYLRKSDLQKFIKRLRKNLQKYENETIRYFAVGEYGPDKFRPHFHILFFVDSPSLCQGPSGHTLGEFPRWTWSKRKDRSYTEKTPLSKLEYYVRKSWSFGRVDAELIQQGSASSYVAGYVNSSVPLPPFLTFQSTKPFSVHSRFLGRKIFGEELISVLKQTPKQFVNRSFFLRGKLEDVRTPSEMCTAFYPKCKGFTMLTHEQRLNVYKLYGRVRSVYGTEVSLIDISRSIVSAYHDYQESGFLRCAGTDFLQYFFESVDMQRRWLRDGQFDEDLDEKFVYSVYQELLVSRLFMRNAAKWYAYLALNSPAFRGIDYYELYLKKIERFWKYVDYKNLTQWYEKQAIYFASDFASSDDMYYFYNNVAYDLDKFKDSFPARAYKANVTYMARTRMKHKLQNDKNLIFQEDGKYNVYEKYP